LFETLQQSDPLAATTRDRGAGKQNPGAQPLGPMSDVILQLVRFGELATLTGLLQATAFLESIVGSLSQYPENLVLRFLDAFSANARGVLEARLQQDPAVRRVWQIIDLTLATIRGGIRFGLMTDPRGFDAIDE